MRDFRVRPRQRRPLTSVTIRPRSRWPPSPATQRNEVPIAFALTNAQNDVVDVDLEFCLPSDGCDIAAAPHAGGWRVAALGHGSLQGLQSGAAIQYVVTWGSVVAQNDAAPDQAQGIGEKQVANINVRARASSEVDGLARIYGAWSQTAIDEVSNESAPTLNNVNLRRLSLNGGVSPVAIDYTVIDEESDTVDFDCAFSQDGGVTFNRCAEYADPRSEGRVDLASGPTALGGGGGLPHTFIWDPTGQMLASTGTQRYV